MAKVLQSGIRFNRAADGAHYFPVTMGANYQNGTETNWNFTHRTAGTYSNFFLNIYANTAASATVATIRVNQADGNGTVSVTAGTTGTFEDTVNTDAISSGDEVCAKIVFVTGTLSGGHTILFDATSNTCCNHSARSNYLTGNTIRYNPISGYLYNTIENLTKTEINTVGTLKNLNSIIYVNSFSVITTVILRINSANGNGTVSIGAGVTGSFEDVVNTDNISVNDLVNIYEIDL